jgi:uncharacterized membrane protein
LLSQPSLGIIPNIMSRARGIEIDNQVILIAVVVATLLLFPLVAFTSGGFRIAFGLLFALFFPGYALVSALFPKRDRLGGIERLALSFGLSIAVVPLIGLILNFTPWGIKLYPIVISVTIFILAASVVGWYRQRKLEPDQRFKVVLKGPS